MSLFVAEAIPVGRWIAAAGECSRSLQDNHRCDYQNGLEERITSTTLHLDIRNCHPDHRASQSGGAGGWPKISGHSIGGGQRILHDFGKKFMQGYSYCGCQAAFGEGRQVLMENADTTGLRRRWQQRSVSVGSSHEGRMSSSNFAERDGSNGGDWSGEQVAAAIAVALRAELHRMQTTGNGSIDGAGSEDGRWGDNGVVESSPPDTASYPRQHVDMMQDGNHRGVAVRPTEANSDASTDTQAEVSTDADSDDAPTSPESVLMSASSAKRSGEVFAPTAKELVYQVLEVVPTGEVFKKHVTRRQLLRRSGLRPRDLRRIDPSLWVTNALPALLVRDHAILINLGSLRAIVTPENVLVFDESSIGARNFLDVLLQRLQAANNNGGLTMPFELEVLESALISRAQRLENALNQVEPRVASLLAVLPNKVAADALEELRMSKQALVELGSKAGALRQMLLEILETPNDIRRISAMGHHCDFRHGVLVCETGKDREDVEEEEEEVEMLLEYYLQRVDLCHGQAEKLLESAKEMEDSIAVNLSSRRLEVGRFELMLAIATFAAAIGAMIAGIFGMNLRSYLEEHVSAFWATAGGIVFGCVVLFFALLAYLRKRKIL